MLTIIFEITGIVKKVEVRVRKSDITFKKMLFCHESSKFLIFIEREMNKIMNRV